MTHPAATCHNPLPKSDRRRLAVFARYPRLGLVKTRLAASLGAEAALRFHSASLRLVIERMSNLRVERHLLLEGCNEQEAGRLLADWAPPGVWNWSLQPPGDLGRRLQAATDQLLGPGTRLVFLGSDSPSLPVPWVAAAFEYLESVPVVVGPADDGGYYLIGLNRKIDGLFSDISWGTPRVLQQTLDRLQNLPTHTLPSWFDVDDEPSLQRLLQDPVIAGRLRELGAIGLGLI